MALAIDITDEKGVKTRYHAIKGFSCDGEVITAKLRSYVNKETRDAEQHTLENNQRVVEYERGIEERIAKLDALTAQQEDERDEAEIQRLAEEINTLKLAEDKPTYQQVIDRYYSEQEVQVPYFEPFTVGALYAKITETHATFTKAKMI